MLSIKRVAYAQPTHDVYCKHDGVLVLARIVAILDLENVCSLQCAEYLRRATAVLIVLCTAMFKTHPDYAGCGLT